MMMNQRKRNEGKKKNRRKRRGQTWRKEDFLLSVNFNAHCISTSIDGLICFSLLFCSYFGLLFMFTISLICIKFLLWLKLSVLYLNRNFLFHFVELNLLKQIVSQRQVKYPFSIYTDKNVLLSFFINSALAQEAILDFFLFIHFFFSFFLFHSFSVLLLYFKNKHFVSS